MQPRQIGFFLSSVYFPPWMPPQIQRRSCSCKVCWHVPGGRYWTRYGSISSFHALTNFSTSVRGGIYHFNPRLAQSANVRVSFISKPANRWPGHAGDAHSPAAIVPQPSCAKSFVMNKGSLSEQHFLQPFSLSVLEMSFAETKARFIQTLLDQRSQKARGF